MKQLNLFNDLESSQHDYFFVTKPLVDYIYEKLDHYHDGFTYWDNVTLILEVFEDLYEKD